MHIKHERAAEGYLILILALSEFTNSKLTCSSQKTALSSPLTAQSPLIAVFGTRRISEQGKGLEQSYS